MNFVFLIPEALALLWMVCDASTMCNFFFVIYFNFKSQIILHLDDFAVKITILVNRNANV